MRVKLTRTPEYRAAKKDLSLSARIALRFIERDIRANPDDPGGTFIHYTVPGYSDVLTVVENGDLLVAFHRASAGEVSLDLVMDRKNPPSWYLVE